MFLMYITNHETATSSYASNHSLRLQNILDSVTKKVGRHLHHCRLLPPEDGYKRAIEILWKLYGNPAQIRESVIGDLKKGGPIPKNDKNALLELSLEVSAAHEVLKALSK